jgi:pimeloyl-ACP methyl ester carboxylesterase
VAPSRLPRKQRLQVRARTIEYVLSGSGSPALLLFSGAGVTLEGWGRLYPGLDRIGRTLAWNRPGVGRSSGPHERQDGRVVVDAVRSLASSLGIGPPYVLVGHSLGGLHAQLFARRHSEEVAGVVLVESLHVDDRGLVKGHEGRLASVLGRMLSLPPPQVRASLRDELAGLDATAAQVQAAGPFPSVPLAVITGGTDPPQWLVPRPALRSKRVHQKELARLSPLGVHVVARRSGHFPQWSQPQLVLDAVRSVVGQGKVRALELAGEERR